MEQPVRRSLSGPAQLTEILVTVLDHLAGTRLEVDYRLVGTSAALLQGVPVNAGDVDILVARRVDVDTFAAALSPFACRTGAVWLPDACQYFARYAVDGIDVEISTVEQSTTTDTTECVGSGPWRHYVPIACGTHMVPAVRLELRLVSELVRDRRDRVTALIAHLRTHGADLGLLHRALTDHAIPPEQQLQVFDGLRPR
jgi:hypothetical protein